MWQKIKNLWHLGNAFLANLWYGFPGRKIKVVGVTGTDGKTTTVHLIYEILKAAGKRVSMISSMGAVVAGEKSDIGLHVTTPNSWLLQKIVRRAVNGGEKYLVLEVTSHALDQNRVWGIPFEIGVLTNVSSEHLDYHKTYQEYFKTKVKLLRRAKVAVVNKDDITILRYYDIRKRKITSYGIHRGEVTSHNFRFSTSLPGKYNKLNCLAAISVAKELGIKDEIIREVVSRFSGVVGRFEFVPTGRDFQVIIDFAHTPNALANVLKTIRPMVKGRLIHVFGCAGLRDFQKRPLMGEISTRYADIIILTEEDYRTEDLRRIMEEIEKGAEKESILRYYLPAMLRIALQAGDITILKIQDRQEAINKAISLARKGDVVLLTGKGHERSLCRGKKEYPWSEHEAVKQGLRLRL